jgi:hypothetical protein
VLEEHVAAVFLDGLLQLARQEQRRASRIIAAADVVVDEHYRR